MADARDRLARLIAKGESLAAALDITLNDIAAKRKSVRWGGTAARLTIFRRELDAARAALAAEPATPDATGGLLAGRGG